MCFKQIFIYSIIISMFGVSCIRKEAPNAEADIINVIVPNDILRADPIIQNNNVLIMVKENTDLTTQSPEFELTPGATIVPESGTVQNFTTPREYVVTSEDKLWSKKYNIMYLNSKLNTKYNFEDTIKKDRVKYYIFAEKNDNGGVIMEWASGNAGFAKTAGNKPAEDYPTFKSHKGRTGDCLKLVTRSTGTFGATVGMPIAAGNLFMGVFDVRIALTDPLAATKFGIPFTYKPMLVTGYYKYKAGAVYKDKGVAVPGKKDIFNIYAVFFETDKDLKYLNGSNQLTHPNIVAIAKIDNPIESEQWNKFTIPFQYKDNKVVDSKKLEDGKYSISLIFTSSADGDIFSGAEGSELMIDDVEIIYSTN